MKTKWRTENIPEALIEGLKKEFINLQTTETEIKGEVGISSFEHTTPKGKKVPYKLLYCMSAIGKVDGERDLFFFKTAMERVADKQNGFKKDSVMLCEFNIGFDDEDESYSIIAFIPRLSDVLNNQEISGERKLHQLKNMIEKTSEAIRNKPMRLIKTSKRIIAGKNIDSTPVKLHDPAVESSFLIVARFKTQELPLYDIYTKAIEMTDFEDCIPTKNLPFECDLNLCRNGKLSAVIVNMYFKKTPEENVDAIYDKLIQHYTNLQIESVSKEN